MAAKVYPQEPSLSSCKCKQITSKRETFTLWMKSLVFHSNGCTVYDSNGDVVYRVDNYDRKGRREVNLMDIRGRNLCTIQKRLLAFGSWDGYRSSSSSGDHEEMLWFRVKKCNKMYMRKVACEMKVGCQKYWIVRIAGKVGFRIVDIHQNIVAEVKGKQSSSGVALGDDVLTMDVETDVDHSLIMGFVTVYGLICGRM